MGSFGTILLRGGTRTNTVLITYQIYGSDETYNFTLRKLVSLKLFKKYCFRVIIQAIGSLEVPFQKEGKEIGIRT